MWKSSLSYFVFFIFCVFHILCVCVCVCVCHCVGAEIPVLSQSASLVSVHRWDPGGYPCNQVTSRLACAVTSSLHCVCLEVVCECRLLGTWEATNPFFLPPSLHQIWDHLSCSLVWGPGHLVWVAWWTHGTCGSYCVIQRSSTNLWLLPTMYQLWVPVCSLTAKSCGCPKCK